ncbi:hypothetical protein GGI24_006237, partial [Coemansia furcata]
AELHRIDWAIGQLRRSVNIELSQRPDDADLHLSIAVERRICLRLCAVSEVLQQLLGGSLPKAMYDVVIRGFQDVHRTWALMTRAKMSLAQLPITESYINALSLICTDLNTHAYALITNKYSNMIETSAEEPTAQLGGKKLADGKDGKDKMKMSRPKPKSKVMRDSSLVSSLVYQMELSEKYVIQLSTKFKTPLAHYLKRSTVRDFKIKKSDMPEPMAIAASDNDDDDVHVYDNAVQANVQSAEEEEEEEEVIVSDAESEVLPGYSSSEDTADLIRGKRVRRE